MTTSADVRADLLDALRLDLVGPRPDHPPHAQYADELLPVAPSKWYLTGFLVPFEARTLASETEADEGMPDEVGKKPGGDDDETPEQASARKAFFPSSIGLSVLVPEAVEALSVRLAWADYVRVADDEPDGSVDETPEERAGRGRWRRVPREASLDVPLSDGKHGIEGTDGIEFVVSVRPVGHTGLVEQGTRSVSVFVVNNRKPAGAARRDAAYVFQPELTLSSPTSFVARPDLRGQSTDDWDEQVADVQYRDAVEYVVGHNISGLACVEGGACHTVCSAWMPVADVEKVIAATLGDDVQLEMEALGRAESADEIRAMVGGMVTGYAAWIAKQPLPEGDDRARIAERLLQNADRARKRIQAGLDALDDPLVLSAFRLANGVIARAIRQRVCHDRDDITPDAIDPPRWRPFQLAFLLMNIPGAAHPAHADRGVVDLLFFPTGGGKTEAYLGLAAFVMALRRLRDPSVRSAGVSVIMRYTLRLLTLDQLGRAATLVCAMELARQKSPDRLGPWPFEIGLWVGQTATPNRMGRKGDGNAHSARARTIAYLNDTKRKSSPIPLENCPWCGWQFDKDCFKLLPNADEPSELRVACRNRKCAFHSRRQSSGLPILAVDDPIYRRLPAFLIATVDKFANLPWVGESAGLFGRVQRYDTEGFYGPSLKGRGKALGGPLPAPDLVIQDELHLISGPLGTMVGLYETAIDALASHPLGAEGVPRPKIVASTATVRRAERQIRGLFGRTAVDIFPPPGPDRRDSYFAITVSPAVRNARTYVGVAAQGRNLKVVLLRTYLALMAAAQKAWKANGGAKAERNPADPYMTLLGYFNSLRELGGSRRIVEDEVATRLADYAERRQRIGETTALFANRKRTTEPRELTSRVKTHEIAETKRRVALSHADKEHVDVALATNMISVGLDITRLGLMVVLGQPKSAAEYIQATSRVGRDDKRPGLVVTLLNIYRPRDRSYYERFTAWHESFYRAVEATSVTPFSPRAIDRGIAGVTVALARHGHEGLTAPRAATDVAKHRAQLDFVADIISRRAEAHDVLPDAESEALRTAVKHRVEGLLDAWSNIAQHTGELQYQREVGGAIPPLLYMPLDPELKKQSAEARQFTANRSLRDVEPTVNLWLLDTDDKIADVEDEA